MADEGFEAADMSKVPRRTAAMRAREAAGVVMRVFAFCAVVVTVGAVVMFLTFTVTS